MGNEKERGDALRLKSENLQNAHLKLLQNLHTKFQLSSLDGGKGD